MAEEHKPEGQADAAQEAAGFDLIVEIGPLGWERRPLHVRAVGAGEDVHLADITRGEGQALRFHLVAADCSSGFMDALSDGRLLADLKAARLTLHVEPAAGPAIKTPKGGPITLADVGMLCLAGLRTASGLALEDGTALGWADWPDVVNFDSGGAWRRKETREAANTGRSVADYVPLAISMQAPVAILREHAGRLVVGVDLHVRLGPEGGDGTLITSGRLLAEAPEELGLFGRVYSYTGGQPYTVGAIVVSYE